MAAKKPQPQVDASKVLVQQGVDAESSYLNAQTTKSDKQWLDETSQAWEARQTAEKAHDAAKSEGQAVINLADATGAVGEKTGASLIVADASEAKDKEAGVAVKKKDDDSNDKGGYIWGGLGVLGLIGIAAAGGGGGGGDSTPAPTPLALDGLVIDDPVANAIVFRDTHGDGYLHVIEAGEGRYIVDPDQALVVTNARGEFADLGGSGRIISVGINRLPIKVYDESFNEINPDERVANEGDRLFASAADEDDEGDSDSINDGNLAFIVGENQIFDSLVISSGITLSVGGSDVTLVTGVTALVDAYIHRYEDADFVPTNAQIKTAIIEVADLFGYELNANSSEQSLMSFLLGGYDVTGVDSPNNLNQEIYSIVNSLYATNEALNNEQYDAAYFSMSFNQALNAIILVQEERVRNDDQDLASLALNPELLGNVTEEFIQLFNQAAEFDAISNSDAQIYMDVARNHANLGGGAADIYETFDEGNQTEDDNFVNMVAGGDQLREQDVEVVGNITVLAAGQSDNVSLDLGEFGNSLDASVPVELMGSNILISAYGEDSYANLNIVAVNAPGTEMSNGTYTYDAASDETVAVGDITVQAGGEDSQAGITMLGDLDIAGDISVTASGEDSDAQALLIAGSDATDIFNIAQGVAASAIFEVDLYYIINEALTTNRSVIQLIIDGKVLSANVNDFDNNDEAIADIINQWNLDSDYSTLSANQIEYWGDFARIRFDDTASHDVEVKRFNGGLVTNFVEQVDEVQENVVREAAMNFEGSHIEVIQSSYDYFNFGGEDFNTAGLLVLGATGNIDGIDVIADGFSYNSLDDNFPSAQALINIDGSVSGEINVKTLVDGPNTPSGKGALLFVNASAGELHLDDVSINVTAEGFDSGAGLAIGVDTNGLPLPGFNSLDVGSTVVTGTINGITVSALGVNSDANLDISGDITIGGTILVETAADNAYASLDISSYFGNVDVLASSAVTFDNVDIIARAYGEEAEANLSADNTNAQGSINSILLVAHADGALDGSENASSADVSVDINFNGELGDITVQALGNSDDADLFMRSSSDREDGEETQFYTLNDLIDNASWNDLQSGDKVTLTLGDVDLTATINENVYDDGFGDTNAVEVLADVVSQFQALVDARNADDLLSDLNVVIKQTGNTDTYNYCADVDTDWYGADGIWVRWLEAGNQLDTTLNVDGDLIDPSHTEDGEALLTSIEFMDSDIIVESLGESADADLDIEDGTGRINSITLTANSIDNADASADIELGGLLGDVTITADGEDTDADLEMNSAPLALTYDQSDITLTALGDDAEVDYQQESYANGVINSLNSTVIGYNDADSDVVLGGDITFASEINVYARSTSTNDGNSSGVDNKVHLANEDQDDGMNSTFHMDGVTINVESVGYDAYAELTTLNYANTEGDFSSDSSIDSKITGTINALNVYAGVYDETDESIDPTLIADASASVDLNVHGVIEAINIKADNVSSVETVLHGAINANDQLTINIENSNSAGVEFGLLDVYGDIVSINATSASEGASTLMGVRTDGSIGTVNLTTTQDAETVASFDINGSQNYINNLTITNLGTSYIGDYTSVSDVHVDQEAHGGVVNIINGQNSNLRADTRVTYHGNFQADSINISANDGVEDKFGLHISMDDVDNFSVQHQTALVNNMTSITGLVNGYYNPTNNFIQFADLDDDNYGYDLTDEGGQADDLLSISHYSNGLDGWRGGNSYFDEFEGSSNANYEGNGFYGSFNEFYDAAQYGIASEYAFIDLNQYDAAGGRAESDASFDTDVELLITYFDADGTERFINLDWNLGGFGDDDLAGSLLGESVDVSSIVNGLNADTNWDGDDGDAGEGTPWSLQADLENNVTLFDNGGGILGIRIGEGHITSVELKSIWSDLDTTSGGGYTNLGSDSDTDDGAVLNNQTLDDFAGLGASRIDYVEGGGYFFGMVLDQNTYRGVLAMDEDGEGVTKLIELADLTASYNDVDNFLDGDESTDYNTNGYDQFSTAYIGMAYGNGGPSWAGYPGSTGFDYETTAFNYELLLG